MRKNKGQTMVEFILVFIILIIITTGISAVYKRFWKIRYVKAAIPSHAITKITQHSNYVK
jgi:Na+-transporting methylmalonyl-CoA/oxaloacetate decarboxylase gamma subunit